MLGSVDRRGKMWRARYRDPSGRQRSRNFVRKLDAQRWLASMEVDKGRGQWIDPQLGRMSVGNWARTWASGLTHLKPSTRTRYDVALRNQVLPTWERVPLTAVTHGDVISWVAGLTDSGLAPATVRYAFRVLSLAMAAAVRDSRLARNPAEGVKLPRVTPSEMIFLDHDQVDAFACAAGHYSVFIRVLAYTGLRWGEATAMRARRVDLTRRRIEVVEAASEHSGQVTIGTPKSHRRRFVPFPQFLVHDLTQQLAGKSMDDLVFTAPGGGPLRNSNFRRDVFDPAARAVGLTGLRPHDLRHTAASLAIAAGANVKAVQHMLGHASAAMTLDVYSGLFGDDLDAVADRLDAAATARKVVRMWSQDEKRRDDDAPQPTRDPQNPRSET